MSMAREKPARRIPDYSPRVGIYARVSTTDQEPENQVDPLRAFAEARAWVVTEYVDHGVSGMKDRRPALDAMLAAARARKLDAVVCTKLDRLARSTHHLVVIAKELQALGVDLVVLDQAIDTTTPSGRLLFHVLAAISEFERDLIRERVIAGLARVRARGQRLGRPRRHHVDVDRAAAMRSEGRSLRAIARALNLPPSAASAVARAICAKSPPPAGR
jgi:DNA invertase Pin-like site-specific DNA recombinase